MLVRPTPSPSDSGADSHASTVLVAIALLLAAGLRGTEAQTDAVPSPLLLTEAVGSDLEGFWDSGEAEGGATLFAGPTLAFSPMGSWRLVIGGGPVLRATSSTAATSAQQRSGYVLRTSVRLGW